MNTVSILPFRRGEHLDPDTRAELAKAGVIVVECDDPASLRLVGPSQDVPASGMIHAALRAMLDGDVTGDVRKRFAIYLLDELNRQMGRKAS